MYKRSMKFETNELDETRILTLIRPDAFISDAMEGLGQAFKDTKELL